MIKDSIIADLKKLGIVSTDVILMHSSLSSLGYVEGGANTVINALLEVLFQGTLLVPALSYSSVTAENPVFSVNETPSCVGKISETFRRRSDVIRSVHPTHSVCGFGKYANEILSKHINSTTPAGPDSPFALLPQYGGKILMLGCGLRPNTSMHAIEELTRPDYLMNKEPRLYTITDKDGKTSQKYYETHNFKNTVQRYDRLEQIMEIKQGKVLQANCYLINSKEMWEKAHETYQKNSRFFVDSAT